MIVRIVVIVAAFLAVGYFGTRHVSKTFKASIDGQTPNVSTARIWLADAVSARKQYQVFVFGNGSIVVPGRRVSITVDKPVPEAKERSFTYVAYDSEPRWLVQHRKALIGLREGSQVSLGQDLPNVTINSVCDEVFMGFKCKPPTGDSTAHPELLACEKPTSNECAQAIDSTIKRAGRESYLDFAEVCLMEKDEVCSGVFSALLAKWQTNVSGPNSSILKDSVMTIPLAAKKVTHAAMVRRLLHAPVPIAEIVLNEMFNPIDVEKMRTLLVAIQENAPAARLIVARIVTRIHDGSGTKMIADTGLTAPPIVTQVAALRNSAEYRKQQIEASIRTGRMSAFEREVYKSPLPFVPAKAKPLDLVRLSSDGYSPYMLVVIAGRNFTATENVDVPPNDPNLLKANTRGETVLHFLAERGQEHDIRMFLERHPNANVDAKDIHGKRPIDWARERNFETVVNYLESRKK